MSKIDVQAIRRDFPILGEIVNGYPLVYLDNAATTQKPRQVIAALTRYYETTNSNIHRGIHTLAVRATEQYEGVRPKVARHIGASRPDEIIFTRNTTEAINLVAHAWGDENLREGDEILLTEMEHHSNIVPWQLLARRKGAVLRFAAITDDGYLDMASLREQIGPRTKLVSMVHMSNVLGVINPVAEVADIAHRAGAVVLVDGAQSAPHLPVDVAALGCDFFAFSAHKMLGPTGVGVLWGRQELLEQLEPFLGGGEMISVVKPEGSTWAELPHRFEAGTPNIAEVIAFGTALDYLAELGMANVRDHEMALTQYALDCLGATEGVRLQGPLRVEDRGGAVSFTLEGVHPHDVSTVLDSRGIAIRAGHHCAQLLMRRLGVPATNRASFYIYNEAREIDLLVDAVDEARKVFTGDGARAAVR
ncbi:MAG: cysteine desulfurase [Tepidiformaceae bacterium]